MPEFPLVSVIVPAYNTAETLEETLHSVLRSDYPSIEVLIVDDGSSDRTLDIARRAAVSDHRIRCLTQPHAGVSRARNHALKEAKGHYILPMDADDLICPTFVSQAVSILENDTSGRVMGVFPYTRMFGDRKGDLNFPAYDIRLLARKNILIATALYRKSDADRFGGYCEDIIAREDWDFWISMLKEGGTVIRLKGCDFSYRVSLKGKHVTDRRLKHHVVNVLNVRHPEFFQKELGGPLRYHRSWSRILNTLSYERQTTVVKENFRHMERFATSLPWLFALDPSLVRHMAGRVMCKGRNELRSFESGGEEVVVKSFGLPHFINRIAYGFFRPSKAQRSFEYASLLMEKGFFSPEPVAFVERRRFGLLADSYYVCRRSKCRYSYADLLKGGLERSEEVLRAIGSTTARLHNAGMIHKDYSRGNLLFDFFPSDNGPVCDEGGEVRVEIIDLNRFRFHEVCLEEGCANFDRLPGTPEMAAIVADAYCRERGYAEKDREKAISLITSAMWKQMDCVL